MQRDLETIQICFAAITLITLLIYYVRVLVPETATTKKNAHVLKRNKLKESGDF